MVGDMRMPQPHPITGKNNTGDGEGGCNSRESPGGGGAELGEAKGSLCTISRCEAVGDVLLAAMASRL
jgi:hypothetical protein